VSRAVGSSMIGPICDTDCSGLKRDVAGAIHSPAGRALVDGREIHELWTGPLGSAGSISLNARNEVCPTAVGRTRRSRGRASTPPIRAQPTRSAALTPRPWRDQPHAHPRCRARPAARPGAPSLAHDLQLLLPTRVHSIVTKQLPPSRPGSEFAVETPPKRHRRPRGSHSQWPGLARR